MGLFGWILQCIREFPPLSTEYDQGHKPRLCYMPCQLDMYMYHSTNSISALVFPFFPTIMVYSSLPLSFGPVIAHDLVMTLLLWTSKRKRQRDMRQLRRAWMGRRYEFENIAVFYYTKNLIKTLNSVKFLKFKVPLTWFFHMWRSTNLTIMEMQIKIIFTTSMRMVIIKKTNNNWWGCEKLETLFTADSNVKLYSDLEAVW